jgi:hypothetical protein
MLGDLSVGSQVMTPRNVCPETEGPSNVTPPLTEFLRICQRFPDPRERRL